MLPVASCYSEGPALDTITITQRRRSRRSLRALARARRATWRERATESFPVLGNVKLRKVLAGQRPNLPRMPRTRDHDVATARHPGNIRLYAQRAGRP